jgi:hypothetical protein
MRRAPWWPVLLMALPAPGSVLDTVPQFVSSVSPASPDDLACARPCETPGLLTLDTQPWTRVTIDGEVRGTTPLWKVRLMPGEHTIEFRNERAGIAHSNRVVIERATLQRLKGTFNAGSLAATPLANRPTDDASQSCCGDLDAPAFVTLNSEPWGFVFIDGRKVGTTPLFRFRVAPGARHVRLVDAHGTVMHDEVVQFETGAERKFGAGGLRNPASQPGLVERLP